MRNTREIIIWICFLWTSVQAQEGPSLTNWISDGLQAQHQNWRIAQGQDDRMYFANSNGLLQFDGQHWEGFPFPQNQIVRAVGRDTAGRIFVGGYAEFGYWQSRGTESLTYHSLSQQLSQERMAPEEIWHLQVGPDWVLFQSFTTLFLYDYKSLKVLAPPGGGSISLVQKVGNRYFLFHKGETILELAISSDTVAFRPMLQHSALSGANLVGMVSDANDDLLLCTARNGIYRFDGTHITPWQHDFLGAFRKFELNRVLKLQNGDLAFGTILNGLYLTDGNGESRFHLNQSMGLQNNTVLSLYQDRRNHLWIGLDNGIDMVNLNSSLSLHKDLQGELGAIYAGAYFQQNLFLGTNHGLFFKPIGASTPFQLVPGSQGQVWELRRMEDILLIGHNDGTFGWDGSRLRLLSAQSGGWCSADIPGSSQGFIQGTYGGLVRFEGNPQGIQSKGLIRGFPTSVKQLHISSDTTLWAVNPYRGLHALHLTPDLTAVQKARAFSDAEGLPTDFDLRLMGGPGLDILKSGEQFFHIQQDSLIPISPASPLTPRKGLQYIWIGTEADTFWIYPDRIDYTGSTARSSFPLRLIPRYEKIVSLEKGEYLFCLETGYAIFRPEAMVQEESAPPKPLITEMLSLDETPQVILGKGRSITPPELQLSSDQQHLRFGFSLPWFGGKVQFRHRLLGFDARWSNWSAETYREFTNLSPGAYTLEVEEDQYGQRASLSFSVAPPWYRSSLAVFIYLLMGIGVLVLAYYLHRSILHRQQRRTALQKQREFQQQLMRERNAQLEKDVQFKSRELANSTMGLIRKNETLLELKEQLETLYKTAGPHLPKGPYQKLRRRIDRSLTNEEDWQVFETNFSQVHEAFFHKLKSVYPEVTAGDMRLAAFLRMGLSSKEMAPLFNISLRGIENKRYRLRKKMGLGSQENLLDMLMKL